MATNFRRSQRIKPKNKIYKCFFECSKTHGTETDYIEHVKFLLGRDIAATISEGKVRSSSLADLLEAAKNFPSGEKGKVYIVIDNDRECHDPHHGNYLKDIFKWVKENPTQRFCLISNPNFELWLLLHFTDKPKKRCDINRILRKHNAILDNGTKHINKNSFTLIKIKDAIRRAKLLDNPPCKDSPRGLGSTVYKLIEELVNLVDKPSER